MPDNSKGSAQQMIENARTQFAGQKVDPKRLEKARANMVTAASKNHIEEASNFVDEVIQWLNDEWNNRGFTVEQRIFSLVLTYVKLRETFPENKGGKAEFVRLALIAKQHYLEQLIAQ